MNTSLCCKRQKWVMQEHLRGLLWNSKKSFAGNWISNDTKWNWSCESVPFLHEPQLLQPQWDRETTQEGNKGRAYGNEWHHVKFTFHCTLLNFMAAWWGPGLFDTVWCDYFTVFRDVLVLHFIYSKHAYGQVDNSIRLKEVVTEHVTKIQAVLLYSRVNSFPVSWYWFEDKLGLN